MNKAEREQAEAEFRKLRGLPGVLKSLDLRELPTDDRPKTLETPSIERIDGVNKACRDVLKR